MLVKTLIASLSHGYLTMLVIAVGLLAAGAHADAFPDRGRLVIVGGALKPEHPTIYQAFLKEVPPESRVAVIPLASGVPERSGPLTVQDIQAYADQPEMIYDTGLRHDQPERVQTPEVASELAGCSALWFTGGDQIRILRAMRPQQGDTDSYRSVLQVLEAGGTVGGTSAGAAMMSRWMITGGSSSEAMLLGANEGYDVPGVGYVQGMALFGYGLIDQHFLRRGRTGRLLNAMHQLDYRFGFGVSENSAMVVDLENDRAEIIGTHGLTMFDLGAVQRQGHAWSNVRLSILSQGDSIQLNTGERQVASGRSERQQAQVVASKHLADSDMWDRYTVLSMVQALAEDRGRVVIARDDNFTYRMTADETTRFFEAGIGEDHTLTSLDVRLDIEPMPDIEYRIAQRRAEIERDTAE
ncbi:cyanophycinase [Mucisphaera sp.]|uniref:cyanophycinase n=1 Tax=Mucisphaera sp. TaxID=2913024 RepID=UPI003D0F35DE